MNHQAGRPLSPTTAIKKLTNLHNFRTLQFLAQFMFFSKYGEESGVFQEFLGVTQMVKLVLKLTEYHRSYRDPHHPTNIFLQKQGMVGQERTQAKKKNEELHGTQLERIKQMLQRIKEANWSKNDYQPEMFESFPNGKKMQLITSSPLPTDLKRKRFTFPQVMGELLLMLRPVVAILAIRVWGQQSWKPYFLSLIVEVLALWLQRKATLLTQSEATEWDSRQKDLLWRCIFKRPFFDIFKNRLLRPLLGLLMKEDRMVFKAIMYIIDIQSSITLTV